MFLWLYLWLYLCLSLSLSLSLCVQYVCLCGQSILTALLITKLNEPRLRVITDLFIKVFCEDKGTASLDDQQNNKDKQQDNRKIWQIIVENIKYIATYHPTAQRV